MSAGYFTIAPSELQSIRVLQKKLEEAFGTDFNVYSFDGRWRELEAEGEFDSPDEGWEASWDQLGRDCARPCCLEARDGSVRLFVPLHAEQPFPVVATAEFPAESAHRLTRLASLVLSQYTDQCELEQLRNQHQAFLFQVTNDFEELTYLRSMSRMLEIADLKFDFVTMCERMFATLLPLVEAEALILILASEVENLAAAEAGQLIEARRWSGKRNVEDSVCLRLVHQYRQLAAKQPVVKNHFDESPDGLEFAGIDSFILVPVVNDTGNIGWLLALNRRNDRSCMVSQLPWGVSYVEFGTHEATLMSCSAATLATHARNMELFREREELLVSVVRALVTAIEAKDEYTCGHSERVALYARHLAVELGYDEDFCERLFLTGLLHDIGKIGVRDAVLRKPGPLTDDEFEEIKQHPDKGWQILHDLVPLQYVLEGVLHHHEQFDGKGYPDRLAGDDIPLHGRILAICDAFDAMTSDRPYRTGMPLEKAETLLRSGAGRQWDPQMIDAFFRCMPGILQTKESYQRRVPEQRQAKLASPQRST